MGLLDDWLDKGFKTDKDGRQIFYPYGPLVRGYIFPLETDIKKFRRRVLVFFVLYALCGFALIPLIGRLNDPKGTILFFYYLIPYYLWFYSQCRHLERTDAGLAFPDRIAKHAGEVELHFLWVLEITAIPLIIFGFYIIIVAGRNLLYLFAAIGTIVFWVHRAIVCTMMLMVSRRQRNQA